MKKSNRGFPLTEALVFDIVDYLLEHEGYGYSNEISFFIVDNNPRRYTSREVVGILRNRPMFQHAQSSDRRGGIKWRLDILALEGYVIQKGYVDRAEERGFYERGKILKKNHIDKTKEIIDRQYDDEEMLNDTYGLLADIWV
tara:strand:- start:2989 stop:3414 length:426 start_codon:yes stop_codon:yes gene_type:complete